MILIWVGYCLHWEHTHHVHVAFRVRRAGLRSRSRRWSGSRSSTSRGGRRRWVLRTRVAREGQHIGEAMTTTDFFPVAGARAAAACLGGLLGACSKCVAAETLLAGLDGGYAEASGVADLHACFAIQVLDGGGLCGRIREETIAWGIVIAGLRFGHAVAVRAG